MSLPSSKMKTLKLSSKLSIMILVLFPVNMATGDTTVDTSLTTLNQAQKDAMLNKHNKLRKIPKATNMLKMAWDPDLDSTVQTVADKCVFEHSAHKHPKYGNVGENLFVSTGSITPLSSDKTLELEKAVQSWYDEVKDYTYDSTSCADRKQCGHYTQVVWATSANISCAVKYCSTLKVPKDPRFTSGFLVVCQYGPAGNYEGIKPYLKGTSCSACPSSAKICEDGLCTSKSKSEGTDGTEGTSGCSLPRVDIFIIGVAFCWFLNMAF